MIKKRLILLFMAVGGILTAMGANNFKISTIEGNPGEEVTVDVSMQNDDTAVVAEILIPLVDKQLIYVEESCVLNNERINGHQLSAAQTDAVLRIVVYGVNLNPFVGNEGNLLSFKLRLGKDPQTYPLTGSAIVGDAQGNSLEATVNSGAVTILSPELTVITTSADYGHIPIRSTYTRNITLQNSGNEELQISNISFTADEFSVEETSFVIAAGATKNVTVHYAPTNRGAISETMKIASNAINGEQKATLIADSFSVNELHVSKTSGNSDDEVVVSLTMNNMEPIVGIQCSFVLPEELVYVDNSFSSSERSTAHTAIATFENNKLTVFLYSNANTEITGNDGEIATFRVKLNGRNGTYYLRPTDVVLSNITVENMVSATSYGYVTIKSPILVCDSSLDMGDCAVTETASAKFTLKNSGKISMSVDKVTFLSEGFSISETLPISVEAGKSAELTVNYKPSDEGDYATTMNIYTNDPDNRMKAVDVSGHIFEPNILSVDGAATSSGYDLFVSLDNYTDIVAMQLDISWLPEMTASEENLILSDRLVGLSSTFTKIGDGVYRVIIYSLNNIQISDNHGEIFRVAYSGQSYLNSIIKIENIVLSNIEGKNKSSQAEISYQVLPTLATSITLNQIVLTLEATETATLTATVLPELTTDKSVTWKSSNEKVATVDENGKVTAIAVGEVEITAMTNDGSALVATCKVTVEPTLATSITLDQTSLTLKVTETATLIATVLPELTMDKTVSWESSNEEVATVDENGKVTAIAVGEAEITATTNDGSALVATCKVTVEPTLATSITLNKTTLTLNATETATLTATVLPELATNKTVTWKSSDDKVATVDENGKVTAIAVGETEIIVTTNDSSALVATCTVTVIPTLVTSIEVIPQTVEAKENSEVQLTVSVLPEDATNPVVEWSSSDETVATVDNTGLVKVLKEGQTTITATTTDGTNLSAFCVLTATSGVVEVENQDFRIKIDGNNIIVCDVQIGETVRVFAADSLLISTKEVTDSTVAISVPVSGLYFVKVGSRIVKVLVK